MKIEGILKLFLSWEFLIRLIIFYQGRHHVNRRDLFLRVFGNGIWFEKEPEYLLAPCMYPLWILH
ncbi:MAG: hypothetical protein ACXABV_16135, partial [Candidatus Thorarchaeota archaeon]